MKNKYTVEDNVNNLIIVDNEGIDDYYHLGNDGDDVIEICDILNMQHNELKRQSAKLFKQNEELQTLKETLNLILEIEHIEKYDSVKELLRSEIYGLDLVSYESANAFNEYILLRNIFEKHYGEHWDNYD